MPYKFNPLLDLKLDYYNKNSGSGGSGYITNLSLVFCESFTGDGGTTDFTLTGLVDNAVFEAGGWLLQQVETTHPSHVTTDANSAIYDSNNIFTKNRIQVSSINGTTGDVTLSHPPQVLQEFKVWYWYTLRRTDVLSSYYREEFVASMEGDIDAGDTVAAQNVALNTTNFDDVLSNADDTVQKAMDTLDDHNHNNDFFTEANCQPSDVVGDFVYISGPFSAPRWTVAKIDHNDDTKMPAIGVLIHKYTSTYCVVQWIGEVTNVYNGLTVGAVYFPTSNGIITHPPSTSGSNYAMVQRVGMAVASDILLLNGEINMIKSR